MTVILCGLTDGNQDFRRTCCLYLQGLNVKDENVFRICKQAARKVDIQAYARERNGSIHTTCLYILYASSPYLFQP
jgi:hypothetical protein